TPYRFVYGSSSKDGTHGREEMSDEDGTVRGSYRISLADGRMRVVKYIADKNGFRAGIATNEQGTESASSSGVIYSVSFRSQSAQTLVPVGAEPIFPPQPYSYAYDSPNLGGHHGHEESGDGSGRVSGRYFLSDADGRVRTVTYVADEFGFRADVVTNEPGTESRSPADTTFTSSALPGPDAAAAFEDQGNPGAVYFADCKKKKKNYVTCAIIKNEYSKLRLWSLACVNSVACQEQQRLNKFGGEGGGGIYQLVLPGEVPTPYSFGYDSNDLDGHHGHEETGDGSGRVSGRYSLSLADGRTRTVTYVADEFGYRADVVTNEPGTESRSPADTTFTSSALPGPDAAI
ncbi:unnamed protein product, partial [Ixodes pacificus]